MLKGPGYLILMHFTTLILPTSEYLYAVIVYVSCGLFSPIISSEVYLVFMNFNINVLLLVVISLVCSLPPVISARRLL